MSHSRGIRTRGTNPPKVTHCQVQQAAQADWGDDGDWGTEDDAFEATTVMTMDEWGMVYLFPCSV